MLNDEWEVITSLLPVGWEQAARDCGAFRRARYLPDPGTLLRLLLFHAVNDNGLRETVAQADAAGIAQMSQVALHKRLRTCGAWLSWIGARLCQSWRESLQLPEGLRPRAIDSTTVQGPASKGVQWRLHYSLDLTSLTCDGFELTDAQGGERLERLPMQSGDVLLADRNYLRAGALAAAKKAGAYVVIRMRWTHPRLEDAKGHPVVALTRARRVRTGQIGDWPARLPIEGGEAIEGRVIAVRLPAPVAARAQQRAQQRSTKSGKTPDPRSMEAAKFVFLFTTLPHSVMAAADVLALYRYRWQIELAFKRLKQLLKLGRLPHQDLVIARSWILAKLVIALLLETLFRNTRTLSPWGYAVGQNAA